MKNRKVEIDTALFRFDPTDASFLRTLSGRELPESDYCHYVSGTRHPSIDDLKMLSMEPGPGSLILPNTITLVNENNRDRLSRGALYGNHLVWQNDQRAMHTMVFGPTGAGKNTSIIDFLRYSAIADPAQTLVSSSLKASDYGPVRVMCREFKKKLVVLNFNDSFRSIGWNCLDIASLDEAVDVFRRFTESVNNPNSSDSEFWKQWIQTAFVGVWRAGYRSFPAIYQLFSLPLEELIRTLRSHENPSSKQLANFLDGRSHNADTVLASIVGAMTSFLSDSVMRVMGNSELNLKKLFRKPVCLHMEMPEAKMETLLVLYQMFARAVTDELIDQAEKYPRKIIPATLFYDDLPSMGRILTPSRMMTMRSRGIGTVSGVQSLSSLETCYGSASRALIDNIHTKIILPGGVASDSEFFSQSTGLQMVALPTYENQAPSFATRPLLSGADIRSPSYQHPCLGMPATFIVGAVSFQAYLQRSYEHPLTAHLMHLGRQISGRQKLRRTVLPFPELNSSLANKKPIDNSSPNWITNTAGWTNSQLSELLERVKKKLGWDKTTGSAAKWWTAFENENRERLSLVVRLAEELQHRKATITDFFMAYVYSNTDNILANLHYLDYQTLKKAEEAKKKQGPKE
jgi:hypothetical protein